MGEVKFDVRLKILEMACERIEGTEVIRKLVNADLYRIEELVEN